MKSQIKKTNSGIGKKKSGLMAALAGAAVEGVVVVSGSRADTARR